ncbi:MAG: dATP pyrophosphohydrolase [Hyphomicrobiales bacterium]
MALTDTIEIKPVSSKEDLDTFIRLPFRVFEDDPAWIPPLILERRDHLNPKKNPYFQHADVQLFIALRNGSCVGRISAQICQMHQARYGDDVGQFGFLDAIDDAQVFAALLNAAESWTKERGMKALRGPFSFSINEESGLLVDGFDTPPTIMMNHAKPYYGGHVEAAGFAKAMDLLAYYYDANMEMSRGLKSMVKKVEQSGDLVIRPLNKKKFDEELEIIISIFNDAWSDNWGFVPMTEAEVSHLGQMLKLLVTGEYAAIAEYEGKPAAMCVTLPNVNEAIADLNGKLLPVGWAKLLWRLKLKAPNSVRMPLMGVAKEHQTTPVGAALAIGVIDAIRAYHSGRGTRWAELSWILETNEPTRNIVKAVGGKEYKTYRVYERAL